MITKKNKYLAEFSSCEKYRYAWVDAWSKGKPLMVIGLNPSTADENKTDPTIAKCVRLAKGWGYPGLIMCNLFAYRATDPEEMKKQKEPVGEKNDFYIRNCSLIADKVVAAWGNHGKHLNRSETVREMFDHLFCLKENKNGEPAHPLYLPEDLYLKLLGKNIDMIV